MGRFRWLAVGAVVGGLAMAAAGAYAATSSSSLNAGDNLNVGCAGPSLSWSQTDATDGVASCAANPTTTTTTTLPPPPSSSACGLAQAAFCETFDQPSVNGPANQRAGQLNGVVWGTGMVTGNQPGNGLSVNYPNNMQIVNGQLVDTVNDGGTVTSLAMYPRQPFDFGGRTGTVVFDVSNDSAGNHAAWPEFWMSDQPVPDPFTHESSWQSLPRNGFGIRFAGCDGVTCPGGQNYVGVDSAVVVRNGVVNDSFGAGGLNYVPNLGAVSKSGPGQINHYQITVAPNDIEVYGTDAFTPGGPVPPLVHLASIPNANLQFTRGLVWLEDAHYNGNKFSNQGTHTFQWDNLGFDGPVLPRDLGFDVAAGDYQSPTSVTVPSVTNIGQASGALLVFNFYSFSAGFPVQALVNGHDVTIPWPYPDSLSFSPRTVAIPVPLADLVAGDNTVSFPESGFTFHVFNIDLILQGAGG